MARGRSSRSATPVDVANDPLASLLRQMNDPVIQSELVRQQNYLSTPSAIAWADYWAEQNRIREQTRAALESEDRRLWHPDEGRAVKSFGGRVARLVVHERPIVARANTILSPRSYPVGLQVPVGVRFESPLKVVTCARRKVRRAIMFALNKSGKGSKSRRRRHNRHSGVSC